MGDWTEIPVWQAGEARASRSFIAIEDVYEVPMWEVAVLADFMKELPVSDYQPFAIPTAKCWCFTCESPRDAEICQRSANPAGPGECSCRGGGCREGNCVGPL